MSSGKVKEVFAGVKESKKCCFCGVRTHEPCHVHLYGGGNDRVGSLYSCISVPDCLSRMRLQNDLKGTPKTKQYIVDVMSFRVLAINAEEALVEAERMLKGNIYVPLVESIEETD